MKLAKCTCKAKTKSSILSLLVILSVAKNPFRSAVKKRFFGTETLSMRFNCRKGMQFIKI